MSELGGTDWVVQQSTHPTAKGYPGDSSRAHSRLIVSLLRTHQGRRSSPSASSTSCRWTRCGCVCSCATLSSLATRLAVSRKEFLRARPCPPFASPARSISSSSSLQCAPAYPPTYPPTHPHPHPHPTTHPLSPPPPQVNDGWGDASGDTFEALLRRVLAWRPPQNVSSADNEAGGHHHHNHHAINFVPGVAAVVVNWWDNWPRMKVESTLRVMPLALSVQHTHWTAAASAPLRKMYPRP